MSSAYDVEAEARKLLTAARSPRLTTPHALAEIAFALGQARRAALEEAAAHVDAHYVGSDDPHDPYGLVDLVAKNIRDEILFLAKGGAR